MLGYAFPLFTSPMKDLCGGFSSLLFLVGSFSVELFVALHVIVGNCLVSTNALVQVTCIDAVVRCQTLTNAAACVGDIIFRVSWFGMAA